MTVPPSLAKTEEERKVSVRQVREKGEKYTSLSREKTVGRSNEMSHCSILFS